MNFLLLKEGDNIKAVIFDVDNTLIEWKEEFFEAIVKTIKEEGFNYSIELIHKIFETVDENERVKEKLEKEDLVNFINEKCGTNLTVEFVDKYMKNLDNCVEKNESVIDTLEYLSKKYDLYVLTNWFTECQKERLKRSGILKYFKDVIGADQNYFKPNPKTFDVILKNYKKEECVYIGDSLEKDVIFPMSLGIRAIWKTNEENEKYETIKNISDLKNIL